MNESNEDRGSSGINILWPIPANEHYRTALEMAEAGENPNNICPIIKYSLNNGVTMLWMGDLETNFMEVIKDEIEMDSVTSFSHLIMDERAEKSPRTG